MVVVGSSFIGMEAAASLIQRVKVKDITVIGIEGEFLVATVASLRASYARFLFADVAFEKVFG